MMRGILIFVLGAISATMIARSEEIASIFGEDSYLISSDWQLFDGPHDFVSRIILREALHFPDHLENCKETRGPDARPFVQAEPSCGSVLGSIVNGLSSKPNGMPSENFDEVLERVTTPDSWCSETDTGLICYRSFYFAKMVRPHFFAKKRLVADRALFFTIHIDKAVKNITVDAVWGSNFAGDNDFPQLIPVGM